jgi:hypothetical protein
MARTKREIAAKLFEAGLFNRPIYATLCINKHKTSDDPKYRYVEIYTVKENSSFGRSTVKMETIFRFFVTMDEWEKKIFIPSQGLTPGQTMKILEDFWDKRVCGKDPWGREDG